MAFIEDVSAAVFCLCTITALASVTCQLLKMITPSFTQESGNRMTEQNLATVLGPNILHRESKVRVWETMVGWDLYFNVEELTGEGGREGEGEGMYYM